MGGDLADGVKRAGRRMDGSHWSRRGLAIADVLSIGALVALFAWALWCSWHRWGDIVVDCGKEAYVAMRVAQGDLLYRDITLPYPPLAPYLNAWLFRWFGPHLNVLYACGIVSSAAIAGLLYCLGRRALSGPAAAASVGVMLISCAFGPLVFNYVLPYTFGAVYGFVFSLFGVLCLLLAWERDAEWLIALAGFAAGAATLSKLEAGVAAVVTGVAACLGHGAAGGRGWRGVARDALCFGVPFTSVVGACVLWLAYHHMLGVALRDNIFPISRIHYWSTHLYHTRLPTLRTLGQTLMDCAHVVGGVGLATLLIGGLFAGAFRTLGPYPWVACLTAGGLLVLAEVCSPLQRWSLAIGLTGLQWAPVGAMGLTLWGVRQLRRAVPAPAARTAVLLGVCTLGYLARWGFHTNIYWGESAAPTSLLIAGIMVAACAAVLLPPFVQRLAPGQTVRVVAWTVPMVLVLYGWALSSIMVFRYSRPRIRLTTPRGEIYARPAVARVFEQTLQWLAATPVDAEVLVIPEEAFLNFLSGRRSHVRQSTLIPGMLIGIEEQQQFIAQLRAHGPRYIIITGRSYREFGLQGFASYDPLVDAWIREHYTLVKHFQEGHYQLDIFEGPASLGG